MNEMQLQPSKKFRRAREGRFIGGVCAGIGEYVGIDPNIIRFAFGVSTLFGGLGVGVYAVAWLLVPEAGRDTSIVQDLIGGRGCRPGGNPWQQPSGDWRQPAAAPYGAAPYPHRDTTDAPAAPYGAAPYPQRDTTDASAAAYGAPQDAPGTPVYTAPEPRPAEEKAATAPRPAAERPGTDA